MLEDLFKTSVHSQLGDVRRRTRGALLEVVAFGHVGLAIVLLFLGMFLWLSVRMEPWQAATAARRSRMLLAASFSCLLGGRFCGGRNPTRIIRRFQRCNR